MAAKAQGARLNQHRAAGLPNPVDGGGERPEVDRDVSGAVEHQTLDAVPRGALPEFGARGVLFAHRRRIRVAVVLDDKEDRQAEQGCEVHRLMHITRAARPVADECKAHGRPAEATLGIGRSADIRHHDAQVADHGYRAVLRIAVVNVALARFGRARRVGKVLVQVIDQVSAPNQVPAEIAVGETDDVDGLVGQQRERNNEAFIALPTGHGAANQPLPEKVQDAVVSRACRLHPRICAKQSTGEIGIEVRGPQVAPVQNRGRFWIKHPA